MSKKLLIIESPNKIKTLANYLGSDYKIIATIGHIRDLSKFGLGFEYKTFEPKWTINGEDKKKIIENIKKESKECDEIYLATDPDREGEAIAWHVFQILGDSEKQKSSRISFNEISKKAIEHSFENKRPINEFWVKSQFARRIIDRLIGFKLSQLVQNKIKAESAGRVQSVALKFIADRQKEIDEFIPKEWYNIDVILKSDLILNLSKLSAKFSEIKSDSSIKRVGFNFSNFVDATNVFNSLNNYYEVSKIGEKILSKKTPKEPYKTSTLHQDAINILSFSSKQVTSIAQKLYEGIEINGAHIALISYPRTDSNRLSDDFIIDSQKFIFEKYGKEYVGEKKIIKIKSLSQDAHEAIRPVNIFLEPSRIKNDIPEAQWKLYDLIWKRAISYLMSDARFNSVKISFSNNNNIFNVTSRECIFDGYQKIFNDEDSKLNLSINLDQFKIGSLHEVKNHSVVQRKTSPPPKYNQASLIKALEEADVGRPSTYNTMANIVIERGYAIIENKAFNITDIGVILINQLDLFFADEINKDFTKQMEAHLDKIALGEEIWTEWLSNFSPYFDEKINYAKLNMEKKQDEKIGKFCPECNHELVYKHSKKSKEKFIGCSNFPSCKYLESLRKLDILEDLCPVSGHNLVKRKNKKGSYFIACAGFPSCRYLLNIKDYDYHKKNNPSESLPIIDKNKKK
ncbi:MAG: type I DNA topoisomerase [Mycoplasmoidaceae bacterium]